jgi:hypothetical protein
MIIGLVILGSLFVSIGISGVMRDVDGELQWLIEVKREREM